MGEIKIILSDFDGVVANRFTLLSVKDFCSKYKARGVTPAAFRRVSEKTVKGLDAGRKKEKEYYDGLVKGLRLKISARELRNYLVAADRRNIRRNGRFCEWLGALRARGMKIGLATDVSKELDERLKRGGFYKIFKKIYFSNKIGFPKTDKRFWRYVLGDLKLDPLEIVFIDDSRKNIAAARAAGIRSFLFKNSAQTIKAVSKEMKRGSR